MADLTAAHLRELLHYNPDTGEFTWREARGGSAQPGRVAGARTSIGYVQIAVAGRRYTSHRLAWLYMTGAWPEAEIDHVDGNPASNSWANLRQATKTQNQQNRRHAQSTSHTGYLGVSLLPSGRWYARIRSAGVTYNLGAFDSPEAAHEAYVTAKRRLHPYGTL